MFERKIRASWIFELVKFYILTEYGSFCYLCFHTPSKCKMNQKKQKLEQAIVSFFKNKKVLTLTELKEFSNLSQSSIERRLKVWKTYRSYNYNGRYYALPEMVCFNQEGIWKYKGIGFSEHRSLKLSVINLVEQSLCGLSQRDLSELLSSPIHRILSAYFQNSQELLREQEGRGYIYFSKKSDIYAAQKQRREELKRSELREQLPSDSEAIVILVELIKHPTDTLDQLTRCIRRRGISISIDQVRSLLWYHGLLKKNCLLSSSSFETAYRSTEHGVVA